MATTQKTRAARQSKKGSFGLLANGSCGPWDIAIDEATSGPDRWWIQIEGPSVSFYFEILSLEIVGMMARFLKPGVPASSQTTSAFSKRSGSFMLGKDKKAPIFLVKDDEYNDRFFLVIGPSESPPVRFVIAGADVVKLAQALQQAQEDIESES